jgi:hypothetical protein
MHARLVAIPLPLQVHTQTAIRAATQASTCSHEFIDSERQELSFGKAFKLAMGMDAQVLFFELATLRLLALSRSRSRAAGNMPVTVPTPSMRL